MTELIDPPKDRFCDLVMKGGITSGVVYPRAIGRLSRSYRFRSIGGTSAGAIAAVVTAAAEYQRRQTGSRAGFELLEKLPDILQEKVSGTSKRKLLTLFQPAHGARRLFSVLIGSLNSGGTYHRILSIVGGFLRAYWPGVFVSIVAGWLVGALGGGALASVLSVLLLLPILISAWVYLDLTRGVVGNGFGMCTGMTVDPNTEALTPWLHKLIQTAGGRGVADKPLSFGDLWDADDFPPEWLKLPANPKPRSIDLQMFSTNLSHGRPYIFPLPDPDPGPSRFRTRDRLFFKREELARYLPPEVLQWMCDHATPYAVEPGREGIDPDAAAAHGAMELPAARDFPVLLAARMSLSFPLLFSAVPLHAIDHDAPRGQRRFRCCWFSDGGISSNFPMHLFDGLVPIWPTFGIDLEPEIQGREPVYLPTEYEEGYGERWTVFAEQSNPASRLGGFIAAIVNAMQNWNDNALARMPGVRDRVARVRFKANEGGMNLNMEQELIETIAGHGEEAARKLTQRFAEASEGAQAAGWDQHRLVRLDVLLKMLEARAPGVANAISPTCRHATNYATLIEAALNLKDEHGRPAPPPGYERPLSGAQSRALNGALAVLAELARVPASPPDANPFKPIPKPELRVRPPL